MSFFLNSGFYAELQVLFFKLFHENVVNCEINLNMYFRLCILNYGTKLWWITLGNNFQYNPIETLIRKFHFVNVNVVKCAKWWIALVQYCENKFFSYWEYQFLLRKIIIITILLTQGYLDKNAT